MTPRLRRRFGTIKTNSAGNYVGRYRLKGRDYYTPAVRTRAEAEAHLRRVQREIKDGDWQPPNPGTPTQALPTMTFEAWTKAWLKKVEKQGLSPNTVRSYTSIMRRHVNPAIGMYEIRDIRADEIRALKRRVEGYAAPGTVHNIMLATSAAFSSAVQDGIIDTNPVQAVPGVYAKPRSTRQPVAITAEQLRKLIDAAEPYYKAAFTLAGWGALRYGEVAALRRKDINREQGSVTISRAVAREQGGKLIVKPPKSKAGKRTIKLPPWAMETLEWHLDNLTPPGRDALVFNRVGKPGMFITDKMLRKELDRACQASGLPRLRFHDLRHTGLTLYGQAGATLADLMNRAGHADAKTVMIYQHSSLQRDAELANRMG
jgi:integrase